MALSDEGQALFDHAKNSLPRWLTGASTSLLEWLYGLSAVFDAVHTQGQSWIDITYLDHAEGIELDQHALDRGTSRQNGESDSALRERLRSISDAVTEPALIAGMDAILDGTGQRADFRVQQYVTSGWTTEFEARTTSISGGPQTRLTLTLVDDGTNPATLIEDIFATTIHFSSGVTTRTEVEDLVDADSVWFRVKTADASGASTLTLDDVFVTKNFYLSKIVNLRRDRAHMHAPGSCSSFLSRGYRMTGVSRPMTYIAILPYTTSVATAASIGEYLRKNGPGGYAYLVERRLTP